MTKGFSFHGGLFREGFRRLRTVGLILLVLFTVFDMNYNFTSAFYYYQVSHISSLHPMIFLAPFIPVLLTLWVFSFQNSRRDSDFYHSLPVTKLGISTSFLLASIAWSAIIIFGSSCIVLLTHIAQLTSDFHFFFDFLVPVTGAFVGSLITTSLTFLALTLTGNSITALAMTAMFLFGPRLMITYILRTSLESASVYPMDRLDLLFNDYPEGLLYGEYESIIAWIGGLVIIAVVFALGLWLCRRRQSETAGHASVSSAVQVLARLVFTLICSLPIIVVIHEWLVNLRYYEQTHAIVIGAFNIGYVAFWYVLVIIAHSLFELITTKSVKKMVRSLPWLGVVALLNAVIIIISCSITFGIRNFMPTADEIDSVCVRKLNNYGYYSYYGSYETLDFDHISTAYVNACRYYDYDELKLTDTDVKESVAKALCDTVNQQVDYGTFVADVCIYTDSGAHERRIEMNESQVVALLKAMHEQHPFDSYYLENYMIKHERIR